MEDIIAATIPIFICVVLPIAIIWIVAGTTRNRNNKNAEIILKALESSSDTDIEKIVNAMGSREKNPEQLLQRRLLCGCIFTFLGISAVVFYFVGEAYYQMLFLLLAGISLAVGLAYLIVYFVTRKSVDAGRKDEQNEQSED